MKNKITAKFRASRRLCFEDTKRIMSPEIHPKSLIDHFTVACLVAWPLNESEAGGDLVLIETFLLFLC